jgi:hypothetical protein
MNPLDKDLKSLLDKSNREVELCMRWIGGVEAELIIEQIRENAILFCMLIERPADDILPFVYSQMLLFVAKGVDIDDEIRERQAG